MYQTYWRLRTRPFDCGSDTAAYYPSEAHQAALLKLRYALECRASGALLAGGSGTGKTLVLRLLAERLTSDFSPFVHLVFPQMTTGELLAWLAAELGSTSDETSGRSRMTADPIDVSLRAIQRRLTENAEAGRHAVIAVDEAHLVEGNRTFEALRLLMNFENAARPMLTLLLVGQNPLVTLVERIPALDERLGVKCLLRTLSVEETMSYVQHRLTLAGAERPIFSAAALETVHQLSRGVPRRINRLCDLALLIGYAEERRQITPADIEAVSQELATASSD